MRRGARRLRAGRAGAAELELGLARDAGPDRAVFDDLAAQGELRFRFREGQDAARFASGAAEAMGVPRAVERNYEFWLDLRDAENTFAQMVVLKLFYAVRRVVDEAGRALPKGAKVEGSYSIRRPSYTPSSARLSFPSDPACR